MKKWILAVVLYVLIAAIIIPAVVTLIWPEKKEEAQPVSGGQIVQVEYDTLPTTTDDELEEYIKGVVSAEMPALFEIEALKAQAVAARTYAVRKMKEMGSTEVPYDIGQAYIEEQERKKRWGEHFSEYEKRMEEAVEATKGEVMVYEQEPILAVFHGESGGMTENAENVWQQSIPYLKSVDSSLDAQAPDFEKEVSFSCGEVVQKLQAKDSNLKIEKEKLQEQLKILERSSAGYVQKVQVGNQLWSGRQLREALGLRSANFTIRQEKDTLFFTTKGHGHGAGMSQYGANFMAKEGKNYQEILKHYYTGITLENWKK